MFDDQVCICQCDAISSLLGLCLSKLPGFGSFSFFSLAWSNLFRKIEHLHSWKKKQQAKTYGESPTLLFRSPNLGHFKKKNTNMVKFADDKYSQHMLI